MNTKTMLLVASATVLTAFAGEFPTDPVSSVTEPGIYTATGDLTWQKLAVGGAGEFLFDLSGGPYTATLTGTGNNVMTVNAKDTDLTLKGGTWTFTGSAPVFNQDGGTRGVNRKLTLDGATMSGLSSFFIAYGGGDSDATLVLTNGASLTTKNMYTCGYGGGSLRTCLEVMNGSTLTATATSGTSIRSDDGANGASLKQSILVDGTGSAIVSKNHMTVGNSASDVSCEVRNGATLDVTNKQLVLGNGGMANRNRLVVSNEASVVCDQLRIGSVSGSHGNSFLLADDSTATVSTLYLGNWYNGTGTYGNTCEVQNATLTCGKLDLNGAGNSNNLLRVAGRTASLVTSSSWKALTDYGSHNLLSLEDGATWTAASNWRTGEGCGNAVHAKDGAVINFTGYTFGIGPTTPTAGAFGDSLVLGKGATMTANELSLKGTDGFLGISSATVTVTALNVGSVAGARGNRMLATDDAAVTAPSVYVGSWYNGTGTAGNSCTFSNSTLTCSTVTMVGANCVSNVLRFAGSKAKLVTTSNSWKELTNKGSHNRLSFEGGATWETTSNWRTGEGVSNEVCVTDGAHLYATNFQFMVGANDTTGAWHGDRLYVGPNAELRTTSYAMSGNGSFLTISNGTVYCTSESLSSWTGDGLQLAYNGTGYVGTNCVVTLQGDRPLLKSAGYLVAQSNTRIVFDIPAGGYAPGHVPVVCPRATFHHGKAVLVPNVEAFRKSLTKKTTVQLVSCDNWGEFGTVIADSNAVAPEGCTFSAGTDGKSILLTVKPQKRGLVITIR